MKRIISILLLICLTAACFSAFAEDKVYKLGERSIKLGMRGDDVKEAQQLLKNLKYYTGKIDGVYGKGSQAAVKAFQQKNGLTDDGILGKKTAAKLKNNPKAADEEEPKEVILQFGSKGEAVKKLQRELRKTYYYGGKIDGYFGSEVQNAVKAFQTSTGLTADGKVGNNTRSYLYDRKAGLFHGGLPRRTLGSGVRGYDVYLLQEKLRSLNYFTAESTGIFDSDTMVAVKAFQKDNNLEQTGRMDKTLRRYLWPTKVYNNEEKANAKKGTVDDPFEERTIKLGKTGTDVARAQMLLKAGRYLYGNADGVFGKTTEDAVKAFQKDNGLKEDGIIGPKTWAALKTLNIDNAEAKVVDEKKPAAVNPTNELKRGSKGPQVTRLQQGLIKLGFLPAGEDDGIFGYKTYNAVRLFQKSVKMKVTGIVGSPTMVRLNEALGIQYQN